LQVASVVPFLRNPLVVLKRVGRRIFGITQLLGGVKPLRQKRKTRALQTDGGLERSGSESGKARATGGL